LSGVLYNIRFRGLFPVREHIPAEKRPEIGARDKGQGTRDKGLRTRERQEIRNQRLEIGNKK